jgi:hypothetical protein
MVDVQAVEEDGLSETRGSALREERVGTGWCGREGRLREEAGKENSWKRRNKRKGKARGKGSVIEMQSWDARHSDTRPLREDPQGSRHARLR